MVAGEKLVEGVRTMTFEKWMEEILKPQIVQSEDTGFIGNPILDTFGEEEEEEPGRPPLKKN